MSDAESATASKAASAPLLEARRGVVAALPVLLGIAPYGLLLGAQASRKNFSLVEVPLLTGLNFAGGSEFAAIQLWTSPPHILLIAVITFLVNSRHLLMGAALAPYIVPLPKRLVFPALFLMCDESWALGLADARERAAAGAAHPFSVPYYFSLAVSLYLCWVAFTTAGAWLGPIVGDVRTFGFDMAFPAVFLVLLRGMWKGPRAARPWLVSLVAAAGAYLLVPGAWYVPTGALSGVAAAYLLAERP